MLAQVILIVIIFILIVILCVRKRPEASDDSDDETATAAAAGNGNAAAAAAIQGQMTNMTPEKRKELASSSLFHRTLEEGDSIREIQAILSAARDSSSSPTPSAPALDEEAATTQSDEDNPSVSIEMTNTSESDIARNTSPVRTKVGVSDMDRSDAAGAESDTSLVASIRSLTGTLLDTLRPPECTICLDGFEPGQSISWSKYGQCDHIYHTKCIEEWLSTHHDCPLCRVSIVPLPPRAQMVAPAAEAPYYSS
mmetsp:Transcript_18997/g.41384  ORF Transcript_18997/g.41384 Transcript_18997/m.41384 type:complete len:253 (+) Transcript_18997:280-1038(+)